MLKINENYARLGANYLFSEIDRRVNEYKVGHPGARVISLGIGDVTREIAPAVIEAMQAATREMASAATTRGYPPAAGHDFLVSAIVEHDFRARGIDVAPGEVFISDGAKSDTGNIGDILGQDNTVAITDPAYPVYVDTNIMAGRHVELLPCLPGNGFCPPLPGGRPADVIYLCYPNNPTGTTLSREQLKEWVDYALEHRSLILFDAAYEAFITGAGIPRSIYEVEGARRVAIEFRSFSKTAGFTGLRCAYTIVPSELVATTAAGETVSLNALWRRRQATKFNGTAYIIQRGAAAVYSPEGQRQTREVINYYMENARLIKDGLEATGLEVHGGVNAPYLWVKTPGGITSWEFFDLLLRDAGVVGTPGSGFGAAGEGFFRFTAFGRRAEVIEAIERVKALS